MIREVLDVVLILVGVLAVLIAVGTVIANLTFGATYDLDKPNHPDAELPKAKSTQTQARK